MASGCLQTVGKSRQGHESTLRRLVIGFLAAGIQARFPDGSRADPRRVRKLRKPAKDADVKLLKATLLGICVLALVFVAVAYLLPAEVSVVRSVKIPAPPEKVFPYVNSLQKTDEWSPWLALDPDTELNFSGPEEGVGNRLEWSSENESVGRGTQEITLSVPNERVETALDFGSMGTAKAYFDLDADGAETRVTWGLVSELGYNPVARWMGLMLDTWVGADYERGLGNLKAVVTGQ